MVKYAPAAEMNTKKERERERVKKSSSILSMILLLEPSFITNV
jgi:accessory gene regulator protein AgrB